MMNELKKKIIEKKILKNKLLAKKNKEKASKGLELIQLEKEAIKAEYEGLTDQEKNFLESQKKKRKELPKKLLLGTAKGIEKIGNVAWSALVTISNLGEEPKKKKGKKK